MDELYAEILSGCDWDDEDFVNGYHLVVGAIMAAMTPLSITALQSLHRTHSNLILTKYSVPSPRYSPAWLTQVDLYKPYTSRSGIS
jgi:hypothetical protein